MTKTRKLLLDHILSTHTTESCVVAARKSTGLIYLTVRGQGCHGFQADSYLTEKQEILPIKINFQTNFKIVCLCNFFHFLSSRHWSFGPWFHNDVRLYEFIFTFQMKNSVKAVNQKIIWVVLLCFCLSPASLKYIKSNIHNPAGDCVYYTIGQYCVYTHFFIIIFLNFLYHPCTFLNISNYVLFGNDYELPLLKGLQQQDPKSNLCFLPCPRIS